ncbi:MAG: SDR family NAD(P)-dependent oxidoreductase [Actinomycetota bacterium]
MSTTSTAIITGTTSGIGEAQLHHHAQRGWNVVTVNRNEQAATAQLDQLGASHPDQTFTAVFADLSDPVAVMTAADAVGAAGPIDVFYNNAGVLLGEARPAATGIEMHTQVNLLAPYLFARTLGDALDAATVVSTTTAAIGQAGGLRLDELADPPSFKKLTGPYAHTKLALSTLMAALADERPQTTWRSVEPGGVKTPMTSGEGMPKLLVPIRNLLFSSPEKAAEKVAAAAQLTGISNGAYITRGKVKGLPGNASDPSVQAALLAWCREVTGR